MSCASTRGLRRVRPTPGRLERSVQTVRSLGAPCAGGNPATRRRSASALPVSAACSIAWEAGYPALRLAVPGDIKRRAGSQQSTGAGTEKDDKLLEAYVRSGIPPGPSGHVAVEPKIAQSTDSLQALNAKDAAAAAKPSSPPAPALARRAPAGADAEGLIVRQLQKSAEKNQLEGGRARVDARESAAAKGTAVPAPKVAAVAPAEPEGAFAPAPPPRDEEAKSSEERIAVTSESPTIAEPAPAAADALHLDDKAKMEASAERLKQIPSSKRAAGRVFDWVGGEWRERGVAANSPRRQVFASSAAGRGLLRRLPGLADLAGSVVVLRDGDGVVELRPGTPP